MARSYWDNLGVSPETKACLTETFNALKGTTLTFTNVAGKKADVEIRSVPAFMVALGCTIVQQDVDISGACDYLKKKAGLAPV